MDSLSKMSKMFESFDKFVKHGGIASSKHKVRLLPNTRNKMYEPTRDTHVFSKIQPNAYQQVPKIKHLPSSRYLTTNNDIDDLSQYLGNMNVNKKRTPSKKVHFNKSQSPPHSNVRNTDVDLLSQQFDNVKIKKSPSPKNVLTISDDIEDLMKMFGNVKIKQVKKQPTRKTTKKTKSTKASRRKLPKMDVDINDEDFLSGLMNKSMRISTKKVKKPTAQATRRSTRNVKKPERFVPESRPQRQSQRIKQKQDKRSPMKLSPIVEERTKKQRKNG